MLKTFHSHTSHLHGHLMWSLGRHPLQSVLTDVVYVHPLLHGIAFHLTESCTEAKECIAIDIQLCHRYRLCRRLVSPTHLPPVTGFAGLHCHSMKLYASKVWYHTVNLEWYCDLYGWRDRPTSSVRLSYHPQHSWGRCCKSVFFLLEELPDMVLHRRDIHLYALAAGEKEREGERKSEVADIPVARFMGHTLIQVYI